MAQREIKIETSEQALGLFGNFDSNIKLIEKEYGVQVICRGSEIKIVGEEAQVEQADRALNSLLTLISSGENLDTQNIRYTLDLVGEHKESAISKLAGDCICITASGKPVKPKTVGQKEYTDAIENNTIVLGVGPAGTGKTYLAVAMAVKAFKQKQVSRIILTRPAVEAGEKLGFLPGDLQQKVDPYLRPL